jgi:hypothetical protein
MVLNLGRMILALERMKLELGRTKRPVHVQIHLRYVQRTPLRVLHELAPQDWLGKQRRSMQQAAQILDT